MGTILHAMVGTIFSQSKSRFIVNFSVELFSTVRFEESMVDPT